MKHHLARAPAPFWNVVVRRNIVARFLKPTMTGLSRLPADALALCAGFAELAPSAARACGRGLRGAAPVKVVTLTAGGEPDDPTVVARRWATRWAHDVRLVVPQYCSAALAAAAVSELPPGATVELGGGMWEPVEPPAEIRARSAAIAAALPDGVTVWIGLRLPLVPPPHAAALCGPFGAAGRAVSVWVKISSKPHKFVGNGDGVVCAVVRCAARVLERLSVENDVATPLVLKKTLRDLAEPGSAPGLRGLRCWWAGHPPAGAELSLVRRLRMLELLSADVTAVRGLLPAFGGLSALHLGCSLPVRMEECDLLGLLQALDGTCIRRLKVAMVGQFTAPERVGLAVGRAVRRWTSCDIDMRLNSAILRASVADGLVRCGQITDTSTTTDVTGTAEAVGGFCSAFPRVVLAPLLLPALWVFPALDLVLAGDRPREVTLAPAVPRINRKLCARLADVRGRLAGVVLCVHAVAEDPHDVREWLRTVRMLREGKIRCTVVLQLGPAAQPGVSASSVKDLVAPYRAKRDLPRGGLELVIDTSEEACSHHRLSC